MFTVFPSGVFISLCSIDFTYSFAAISAEEAFIYACTVEPDEAIRIAFDVDAEHVSMDFELGEVDLASVDGAPEAAYADLILTAVCDSYAKDENPTRLHLELKADV